MKLIKECVIIFGITLVGELLNVSLPFPVPAGGYGLFILLALLCAGVVRLEDVERTGNFLLDTMPVMFIPAGAALMKEAEALRPLLVPFVTVTAVSTVFVMIVTGKTAQVIIRKGKKGKHND